MWFCLYSLFAPPYSEVGKQGYRQSTSVGVCMQEVGEHHIKKWQVVNTRVCFFSCCADHTVRRHAPPCNPLTANWIWAKGIPNQHRHLSEKRTEPIELREGEKEIEREKRDHSAERISVFTVRRFIWLHTRSLVLCVFTYCPCKPKSSLCACLCVYLYSICIYI